MILQSHKNTKNLLNTLRADLENTPSHVPGPPENDDDPEHLCAEEKLVPVLRRYLRFLPVREVYYEKVGDHRFDVWATFHWWFWILSYLTLGISWAIAEYRLQNLPLSQATEDEVGSVQYKGRRTIVPLAAHRVSAEEDLLYLIKESKDYYLENEFKRLEKEEKRKALLDDLNSGIDTIKEQINKDGQIRSSEMTLGSPKKAIEPNTHS